MSSRQENEFAEMALATELARTLCHEFSNFLYHFFLHLELTAVASAAQKPTDWEAIKREGKNIVELLREWDRFQSRFKFEETAFDLHRLIRQAAATFEEHPIELDPEITTGQLALVGWPSDTEHLFRLLIEETIDRWETVTGTTPRLSIRTEKANGQAKVRIVAEHGDHLNWDASEADGPDSSLLAATCRAIAIRVDATVQRDRQADGRYVVQLGFPLGSAETPA